MTTTIRTRPRSRRLVTALALAVVLLAALAVAFVRGYLPTGSGATHPPCEQLPTAALVDTALAARADLVTQIKAAGPGVTIRRGTPCDDGQDRALVEVTYADDTERDRVTDLLNTQDGFGVPVYLHDE